MNIKLAMRKHKEYMPLKIETTITIKNAKLLTQLATLKRYNLEEEENQA